jgi:hypothetical protein
MTERIILLPYLLKGSGGKHKFRAADFEQAIQSEKTKIKPQEKWEILEDIIRVRKMQERFEEGEIGMSTISFSCSR